MYVGECEWSDNTKSDGLSNSRRTGNTEDAEKKQQRVLVDDEKNADVQEEGWLSIYL